MIDLLREIWSRISDELRERAGEAAFSAWLGDLRPLALERGVCYLEARNRLVCERVQRLHSGLLEELLSAEIGTRVTVSVVPAVEALVPDELEVGPTRPIIDESNRTAFLVLQHLAEGRTLPATLFLFHGPSGAGKTFLLRWWSDHTTPRPRTWTTPGLLKAFGACLRDGRVPALCAELIEPPALIIDELHRIAGHTRVQRELLGVLDAREEAGRTTLLASRWHPREMWRSEPGLTSRLLSGFVTGVEHPGPQARLTYLRALEGSPSRNGRANDIETLAGEVRGGYGELRRAWAVHREAHRFPRSYLQLIDPRAVFARLADRVTERFGVTMADLEGKSQARHLSLARQVLSHLCVEEGLSRAEVGRFLGGRSRAAISYATKTLARRAAEDAEVRTIIEDLR